MDRDLLYPGQIGLVDNMLDAFKAAMVGIGISSEAILGQSTQVFGLAAGALPNAAVSGSAFAISVGRGAIFSFEETDPSAYGVLGTDTATSILKTGINLASTNLGLTNAAPATAGQSINYLISAQFQETDTNAVALPFYNAGGTPTVSTENATRTQRVVFQVTGGTAAVTGSQTTPAAPAGSVPIYVVTITNGQTAVASADIVVAPGAPFIPSLPSLASSVTDLDSQLAAEIATRIAQEGNLKSTVPVYANTTLTVAQQGSFVEIVAGSTVLVTLPTPVGSSGAFFRIANQSIFTQTLQTPTRFSGPGGNGTTGVSLAPGQMVDATSDNASWILSAIGTPSPHYTASQSGSISVAPSTNYTIASVSVAFPSFSKTGALRIRGRIIAQGAMTGSGTYRQNFLSSLSDGSTTFFTGANWLVTSDYTGDDWSVSDYFESSVSYAPGSTVTFTMSIQTAGGNNSFTIIGSFFELFVVEA